MAKKSKDVEYGDIELSASELDLSNSKIRITTMIDMPVYDSLKKQAAKSGKKYQTLLNEILVSYFDDSKDSLVRTHVKQKKREDDHEKRLKALEFKLRKVKL